MSASGIVRLPRQVADAHVDELVALDPVLGTTLGAKESSARLPDFSPEGAQGLADLARRTLGRLEGAERAPGADSAVERRCARLLRERLDAGLALHEAGEHLRTVGNMSTPVHAVRRAFTLMPAGTEEDWAAIGERLRTVPTALAGYRTSLESGLSHKQHGAPGPTAALIGQLTEWTSGPRPNTRNTPRRGWFEEFVTDGPVRLRAGLGSAAREATEAVVGLRDWLRDVYAPAVAGTPDTVGRERYARWARHHTGTDLDLDEAYAYGWSEYHRIHSEMRAAAGDVLPGAATPWAALKHLDEHGAHVDGVDAVRSWLQELMDETIAAVDGTHFELADRLRRVESRIAPPGSAAAPYYTPPSQDFSRPGRTWLPTMGENRFPVYDLVSTWYHEGVPGHHLQLAQWVHVADELSRYQTSVGMVSANCEGWALYAERLMDELGFLTDAERRLGYLDSQMMRALRVIVDIGMHLGLRIPPDSPFRPGERWTPGLAREFFGRHSSRPDEFIDSELTRYLSRPAQAIGYKLGERAWLLGRENARRAQGPAFDAKAWHMAALSMGNLGLGDLVDELSMIQPDRGNEVEAP
ncbi:DUF885 domain-containing protein [Streptomyces sp. NBC_01217]|uniref:DUF885 domain-containing protein n=1 Tax=Streptomyces sp. NBC_01217 TaxID=2903779 RepID=UPI002E14DD16|nr:DUF885 domain-containing protein [Streptomyces sp. NBC_01217]